MITPPAMPIDGQQKRLHASHGFLRLHLETADMRVEKRVWRIGPEHGGRFTAKADDVVGLADGRAAGSMININYKLNLKFGERSFIARFDDRMMLIDQDTMLNRARLSKWGIYLGEVTILFRREGLNPLPRSCV